MLKLSKTLKPWREAGSLNAQVSLYGFWNEHVTLTKSGDVLMVLRVPGIDYESLDSQEQQYAVKRLESALKAFGEGFHVYQYLFKTNRPEIPFAEYGDPLIDAAVSQRREFFEAKRDRMYRVEISYAILLEGQRSKQGFGAALKRMPTDPQGGWREFRAQFASDSMKVLVGAQIDADAQKLASRVEAFVRQLSDFMEIEALDQQGQFTFFRRLLNFDGWRIAGKPKSAQFLDYQTVNSDIEAERNHLRVGDHYLRLLTMKEAIGETRPPGPRRSAEDRGELPCGDGVDPTPHRKGAQRDRHAVAGHFNVAKSGFLNGAREDKRSERDQLIDESKQADIEQLGDCLRALGDGQSMGEFSLTVVLNAHDLETLQREMGEFTSLFTNADGSLFVESYNQLNAFFATVPGNYAHKPAQAAAAEQQLRRPLVPVHDP